MISVLRCVSPVDGNVYAERECMSPAKLDELAEGLKRGAKTWKETPLPERVAKVRAGVRKLVGMNDEIVRELAWQMGRPVRFGGEMGGVVERAEYMAAIAEEHLKPLEIENGEKFLRKIEKEPRGLVLVVAPWNYPFLTAINAIVPALVAGNSVMLKHSTQTLLAGERLETAFRQADIGRDVFTNVFSDHAGLERLIAQARFGFVNFTGSVAGGKAVEKAAAGTFTQVGTELGGKDPGYVCEDADVEAAAASLVDGAMFNSGQCCCGIERIYVHRSRYDDFLDKTRRLVEAHRLGNPLETSTTLGPMAHYRFAETVREQIKEAVATGAKTLIEPSLFPQDGGAYLMPQVLIDVGHDMRIMREESFGPVVGIMKTANDDEAVELMNDSRFGLTASLWTQDSERAERLAGRIETGTVFMNRCDYLDPALCWTGRKDTGRGVSLSSLAYANMTQPKSYHFRK